MNLIGWLQLGLFLGAVLLVTKPLGAYLLRVLDAEGRTFLDPAIGPVERLIYRILGVDSRTEQRWPQYAVSLLVFSTISMLFTYAILRLQHLLPLNPQGLPGVPSALAFNTAASFATNTNWQNYGGESTMSYFSQMVGLTLHNFLSAATGIAVAAALVRGVTRASSQTIGNFWVDITRVSLYLLLPLSVVLAVFLMSQGVIQNFSPYHQVATIEPATEQTIVQGPMASQVAIKMLGTNGGGYANANASHPYENPTPLSNFIQVLVIFAIPSGLVYYLGRMTRSPGHGWSVWTAMAVLFLAGILLCWWSEARGNPRLSALGVNAADGNMEGKEVRFGIFSSALFATVTTDASCGAVNSMHDSFTPLGGFVPLLNMQLGEVVFGGVGAGLYGMLVFVVITVFLSGLMIGRTPEYLGKKMEAYDVKVSALAILYFPLLVLGLTAWAAASGWGKAGPGNAGPHGLSEILYAFTSPTANNGSAFAGIASNTLMYNTTQGIAMIFGRFFVIVPVLALAGSLARKKLVAIGPGSFPASGATFTVLLVGTILIVGALTFFPALTLGPIIEHFLMTGSTKVF